ncbi:MAG: hypothetical protein ACLPTF_04800 [Steroidobacteraceae bacterium]
MAIISKARADANSVVPIGTTGRVIHGDYDPDAQTFYCRKCGEFERIGHFGGSFPDWPHTPTRHLELFLTGLSRHSAKPRTYKPRHNLFTQLAFQGNEPTPEVARKLVGLLWGDIPIDTARLTTFDQQLAAFWLDRFRSQLGDA